MAIINDPNDIKWRDQDGGRVSQQSFRGPQSHKLGFPRKATAGRRNLFSHQGSVIATLWRALTGAQKSAWDTFGDTYPGVDKYGSTIYWSGWNWFTRLNSRLGFSKLSMILTPPPDSTPSYNPSMTFLLGPGPQFQPRLVPVPSIGANEYISVYYRSPFAKPRNSYPPNITFLTTFSQSSSQPLDCTPPTGQISSGQWYAFDGRSMDQYGRVGTILLKWLEQS